jgi:hypothetical protein
MKHLAWIWLVLATGCPWANRQSQSVHGVSGHLRLRTDGHPQGGSLATSGGYAGLFAAAELDVRDAQRAGDPARYADGSLAVSVRASPLGILGTDHWLERYFDLGGEAGAGIGYVPGVPPHGAFTPSAWYGAWVELGTLGLDDGSYLALTGGVRRELFSDTWFDQTQLLVGLAWRTRKPVTAEDLRWRD